MTLFIGRDTLHFRRGTPVELSMLPSGELVRVGRFRAVCRRVWRWVSRPFRKRQVVTDIDHDRGMITIADDPRWWRFLR